ADVRGWLDVVHVLEYWVDAPAEMTAVGRTSYLDAALELVRGEPDLQEWDAEGAKLAHETDVPGAPFDWDPPREAGIVGLLLWLDDFQRSHRWLVFRDRARSALDTLV